MPISIVAITGEDLEMRGIDNLEEVSQGVPNVVITGGGGGTGGTSFRMRGIPNVGTYIDGVWQVGTAGFLTQEFVEIDRVEVLARPAGHDVRPRFDGRRDPHLDEAPGRRVRRQRHGHGRLARPPRRQGVRSICRSATKCSTKWTAASLYRDGYITSLTTGENGGGIDQTVFRGDVVWDADRQARLPLQLPERRERVHRAARPGRDVPHVR